MQFPTIAQGSTPNADGAVTRYVSPEVQNKSWFNPTRPVIFVNGMLNSGADHRASAEALIRIQAEIKAPARARGPIALRLRNGDDLLDIEIAADAPLTTPARQALRVIPGVLEVVEE